MQNLGRINFKIKGGALSLLCIAGAFKLGVDGFVKLSDYVEREEQRKELKAAYEAVKEINTIVDKLKIREADKKVEETEES